MSPPSVKRSRPREFQGTSEAGAGRRGGRTREPSQLPGARTRYWDRAWAAAQEKAFGRGRGPREGTRNSMDRFNPPPHQHGKTREQLHRFTGHSSGAGRPGGVSPGCGPARDAGPPSPHPSPSERRCRASGGPRIVQPPAAANSGKTNPSPTPHAAPGSPRCLYLSRVGLGLRRLEEGVGKLAQPHGHGLWHVGRLGVHDGVEERLQVGLRVPADVHDLVASRGSGRSRGGPGRRCGRRRGALRGRLGRRLLRGLHGCGLVRRSGRCAQFRGAASRARIAQHSVPEAVEPPFPPPGAPSFLPFFAPVAATSQLRQKLRLQTPKLKSCEERPPARLAGSASSALFLPLRARPHRIRGPRPRGKLSLPGATFLQTPGRT